MKIEPELSQEDLIEFASSWVKRTINALIDSPDFQANAKWISERLNISMDHASESFSWLLNKNLIHKTEFGFRTNEKLMDIGENHLTRKEIVELYIKSRAELSTKIVSGVPNSLGVMLADGEIINDFLKKYNALVDAVHEAGLAKGCTNVFAFDLCIPKLTVTKNKQSDILQESLFQAAHDIRGPLSALNMIAHALKNENSSNELSDFLKETVASINMIANGILNLKKEFHIKQPDDTNAYLNFEFFEKELEKSFSSEKRIQIFHSIGSKSASKKFASGNSSQLHRIIKNLIQNSIDAKATEIKYQSYIEENCIRIILKDNGQGFSSNIRNLLGKEGFTTKPEGNGLGLYYAIQNIEKWDGKIQFTDVQNGACIEISLSLICSEE
ncbi:MAG: DUF4423 domain-containing protein [Bdellovibrionales bacterium]|nr:DUF4423 domain-containing protein [Bdellovibrionales bacterium]